MVKKRGGNGIRTSSYAFEYRITMLGDSQSGKSALLDQYINGRFCPTYQPTTEDHLTHVVEHNGNMCVCLFVDTCGGGDFPAMRQLSIQKGNACIIVYSVTDRRSYLEATRTVQEVAKLKPFSEDVKIILVGNKTDLENERQVTKQEGQQYCDSINVGNISAIFFEASAKDKDSVHQVFKGLLDMFLPPELELPDFNENTSPFSRMSIRRKSRKSMRKKKETQSQENRTNSPEFYSDSEILDEPAQGSQDEFYSDSEILDEPKDFKIDPKKGKRSQSLVVTSNSRTPLLKRKEHFISNDTIDSVTSDENESSSPRSNSPKSPPKVKRSSKKGVLNRAFGSMQKLFRPEYRSTDNLIQRANTYDADVKQKYGRSNTCNSVTDIKFNEIIGKVSTI